MKLTGSKGEIVAAAIEVGDSVGLLQCPEGSIPIPPGPEGDAFCKALDKLQVALLSVDTRPGSLEWMNKYMKRLKPFCRQRPRISLRK